MSGEEEGSGSYDVTIEGSNQAPLKSTELFLFEAVTLRLFFFSLFARAPTGATLLH